MGGENEKTSEEYTLRSFDEINTKIIIKKKTKKNKN